MRCIAMHNRALIPPLGLAHLASMSSSWSDAEHALLQRLLAHKLSASNATVAALCLCAQWCGVCRDFRQIFEAAKAIHPHMLLEFVDVEDEADLLDELDIDTFPTLVLGTAERIVFAGPILPQAGTLERHLRLLAEL
jgi:thiol-disulfide isomerase/thioredoxin